MTPKVGNSKTRNSKTNFQRFKIVLCPECLSNNTKTGFLQSKCYECGLEFDTFEMEDNLFKK